MTETAMTRTVLLLVAVVLAATLGWTALGCHRDPDCHVAWCGTHHPQRPCGLVRGPLTQPTIIRMSPLGATQSW